MSNQPPLVITDLNLYPNPAQGGMINFEYNMVQSADVVLRLMDATGREVTVLDQGAGHWAFIIGVAAYPQT